MARAQRLEVVTATQRLFEGAGMSAEATGDTSVVDRLNPVAALELMAEGLGVPQRVVLTDEEMQAKLQSTQQAAEQA
ncbi:hypothetical protein AAGG42_22515, partial [Stenotrophomonas maltophilia]|uniref:hypothetical protein n=1 Tax=Stenotrophomonas maltophilia TaxID=40324 RepID=UPI003144FE94